MPRDAAPVPAMTAHRALADVALAAIESADGRATRWPRATAQQVLVDAGATQVVAKACADAMLAVGATVRARVARGPVAE